VTRDHFEVADSHFLFEVFDAIDQGVHSAGSPPVSLNSRAPHALNAVQSATTVLVSSVLLAGVAIPSPHGRQKKHARPQRAFTAIRTCGIFVSDIFETLT
jgi:hypothetical protein